MAFPRAHGRGMHATNILERRNRELARRCDGIGIFPNVAAVLQLVEEQQDTWLGQRRSFRF